MKKSGMITAFLCAAVLLLVGCGRGKKAPRETKTDEVTYVENKFVNLHCKYPNTTPITARMKTASSSCSRFPYGRAAWRTASRICGSCRTA